MQTVPTPPDTTSTPVVLAVDDPRHGTYAGAVAHWGAGERTCERCRRAATHRRGWNRYLELTGQSATVPSVGTVRRLQALHALGWSLAAIARESGLSERSLRNPVYRGNRIYRTTFAKVAETYDRLSMSIPEGGYTERTRRWARRNGWPPPLAWDDDTIDDPDAEPRGMGEATATRAELLHELDRDHAGISRTCQRLGITREALEKWCQRHGMPDVYSRLVDRETPRYWRNGVAQGGAA